MIPWNVAERIVRFLQVIAWRDGLVALDDEGQLWMGITSYEGGTAIFCWQRVRMPEDDA